MEYYVFPQFSGWRMCNWKIRIASIVTTENGKNKINLLHIKWHELSSSIILSNIFHLEYFEIYRMSDFSDESQCG